MTRFIAGIKTSSPCLAGLARDCYASSGRYAQFLQRRMLSRPGASRRVTTAERQRVEPHIDPAIATTVQALDTASEMLLSEPLRRASGRIVAGPFPVSTASAHAASMRHRAISQIIDYLWLRPPASYCASWVCESDEISTAYRPRRSRTSRSG